MQLGGPSGRACGKCTIVPLPEKTCNMEVVEDFEPRPHYAVTIQVEVAKFQQWAIFWVHLRVPPSPSSRPEMWCMWKECGKSTRCHEIGIILLSPPP